MWECHFQYDYHTICWYSKGKILKPRVLESCKFCQSTFDQRISTLDKNTELYVLKYVDRFIQIYLSAQYEFPSAIYMNIVISIRKTKYLTIMMKLLVSVAEFKIFNLLISLN